MATDSDPSVETVAIRFGGFVRTHGSASTDDWDFLYPGLWCTSTLAPRHNRLAKLWGFAETTYELVCMMKRRADTRYRSKIHAGMSSSEVDQVVNPMPGWQYLWPDEFKAKFDERRRKQGLPPVPWKEESDKQPPKTRSDTQLKQEGGAAPAALTPVRGGTRAARAAEGERQAEGETQDAAAGASGAPHLDPQPASLQVQAVSVKYGGFVRTHGSANTDGWDFLYPGLRQPQCSTNSRNQHNEIAKLWGFAETTYELVCMMNRRQNTHYRSKIHVGMSSSEVDKVVNPSPGWQYLWPDEFKAKFDERRRRQGLPPVPWKKERDDLPPNRLSAPQPERNTRQRAGVVRTTEARAPGGSRAARLTDSEQQADYEMQNAAADARPETGHLHSQQQDRCSRRYSPVLAYGAWWSFEMRGSQLLFAPPLDQPTRAAPHLDPSTTAVQTSPSACATTHAPTRPPAVPPACQNKQQQQPLAQAAVASTAVCTDVATLPAAPFSKLPSRRQSLQPRQPSPAPLVPAAPHPAPQALDSAEPEVDDSPPSKRARPSTHTTHMHKAPAAQATPPGLQRQSKPPARSQPDPMQIARPSGTEDVAEHMPPSPAARAGSTRPSANSSEDGVMVVREMPCVQLPEVEFNADGSISPASHMAILQALMQIVAYLGCPDAADQLVDIVTQTNAGDCAASKHFFTTHYALLKFHWKQQNMEQVRRVLRDRYQLQV